MNVMNEWTTFMIHSYAQTQDVGETMNCFIFYEPSAIVDWIDQLQQEI